MSTCLSRWVDVALPIACLARLEASERGLTTLRLVPGKNANDDSSLSNLKSDNPDLLEEGARQLVEWFAKRRTAFDLPLDLRGTAFQRSVWDALVHIPYGTTRTYGELARDLGRPGAARAVGQAAAANPLPIIIPCHRLVAKSGLGGFSPGMAWPVVPDGPDAPCRIPRLKESLLEFEKLREPWA